MAARRKRAHEEEEHINHERWLITYADMITLLMVLFIVLFAIGQTDLAKFQMLRQSLNNSLGGHSTVLKGGSGAMDGQPSITPVLAIANPAAAQQALQEKQRAAAAQAAEQTTLDQARQALQSSLAKQGLAGAASFRLEGRGLVVTIVTDRVLFDTGASDLQPAGRAVLDAMGPALSTLPNEIAIEGHTDNQPISDARYPSNWELSTARATTVLRYLVEADQLNPQRMTASGYADQRPLFPNDSDTHRTANRRVELVVLSQSVPKQGTQQGAV